MLDVIASNVISLILEVFGRVPPKLEPIQLVSWHHAAIFTLPTTEPDPAVEVIVKDYLQLLTNKGIVPQQQGMWIQTNWSGLADSEGTVPISAASLTKIATTLAALAKWGTQYQFETKIYSTGEIIDGVLQGDLLVEGSGDPFFVWEEAIALGNALEELGIRRVAGDLVVTDKFYMNYQSEAQVVGELLKQALDTKLWSSQVQQQYLTLPLGTPHPQLAIAGKVKVKNNIPDSSQLLLRHQSLPLVEILKQMNIYSNNEIAQMLADAVGGAKDVARYAAKAAKVPAVEIQLVNGSGLGVDNRISPRAVCRMLMAIEESLQSQSLSVGDLFPVAGRDTLGTLQNRQIPSGVAVKTGTLAQVSALAGVIESGDPALRVLPHRGQICFAIINSGSQIEYFRQQQDLLLYRLALHWQLTPAIKTNIRVTDSHLGDPRRNLSVLTESQEKNNYF
ncbi:D-alanyl-D-alanine carboxypeptidase [Pleurocapsales cyanobacterium LEGE 06147]|nr:D-alanyl-D-alanine carboxypeptidase [Pleurocapsales cyanobacterium LEGE 06147]